METSTSLEARYSSHGTVHAVIHKQHLSADNIRHLPSIIFPGINYVSFEDCSIDIRPHTSRRIADCILSHRQIQVVHFLLCGESNLQSQIVTYVLCMLLEHGDTIENICLKPTDNHWDVDISHLCRFAVRNGYLKTFAIGNIRLNDSRVNDIIHLIRHGTLLRLDLLSGCDMDECLFLVFAQAIKDSKLKTLTVWAGIRPLTQTTFMEIIGDRHPTFRIINLPGSSANHIQGPLQAKWKRWDFWTILCAPRCIARLGECPLALLHSDIIRQLTTYIIIV